MRHLFFSIVIPAHNEELLIEQTLASLKALDYPTDRYEVIVAENASKDTTHQKAEKYASKNFKIYSIKEKGVSKARNFGISKCSDKLDFSIVLDADTILKKNFLNELDTYLENHPEANYGMGYLSPDKQTMTARFWFWYRNLTDKLLKNMDTIHIVRKELLAITRYDESYNFTEDLQYTKKLARQGRYFFMKTKNIVTSTRRFEQKGYFKMFVINIGITIMYIVHKEILKDKGWEAIR